MADVCTVDGVMFVVGDYVAHRKLPNAAGEIVGVFDADTVIVNAEVNGMKCDRVRWYVRNLDHVDPVQPKFQPTPPDRYEAIF